MDGPALIPDTTNLVVLLTTVTKLVIPSNLVLGIMEKDGNLVNEESILVNE